MPSFDVVSELNEHELTNAIDQANREVSTRFDFKGTNSHFSREKETIKIATESDFQLKQMRDMLETKLTKRGVDLRHLTFKDPIIQLKSAIQEITLKKGIEIETAKKITKSMKDSKLKVQASIQGEQVRVTGKKRDDLQEAIAMLRNANFGLPLQFVNFRD
ncbi:MAG: YajQ family cyclic di-GMP-binding protein [Gammaproteobacteria bacterium RIFCSPLOWO2_02_FULL_42_14]|nr:MAG: YajQ family cyclic di-GMP-binding protein [Gammaproteobacteria bacterium RIFCSPHIGHO2_02_FULL_42_43]OGT29272.1 MAG: YajQ family cyclic di-GMP-binding protein [Gammaproteobacteria bacterium RIFCSPHIGHO2_01_FULL_42_8]OGT50869.1 MAG: YajQ family cyclic di-GMP-binding protein [Gammaproteobacteria bacterium RIFCSPHIGHO2_12_FULL_41_25]OGT62536.1 MAG: YajQ family cyclic di-GMP-binding protein [Gammaproteobacteria bacterium RIFCSPLOWO2_02_FULL_42_14]OGT86520.1 MAG: YajQ family cyclic di-GMP-bin